MDFLNEKSTDDQWKSFNKWIVEEIQKCKISKLLSFVISDTEHIKSCYEAYAFIRSEAYQNALMTCLLAVETNQGSLLLKIDPSLHTDIIPSRGHRRSISQPQMLFLPSQPQQLQPRKSILSHMKRISRTLDYGNEKTKVSKLRSWQSVPCLHHEIFARPRSSTVTIRREKYSKFQKKVSFKSEVLVDASQEIMDSVPHFEYVQSMLSSEATSGSSSVKTNYPIHVLNVESIEIHTDYRYSPEYQNRKSESPSSSATSSKNSLVTPRKTSIFSFFETSSSASKPYESKEHKTLTNVSSSPTDLFFNIAVPGEKIQATPSPIAAPLQNTGRRRKTSRQNLAAFIQTINNSRPKLFLDRENAHFHLSEAIIATCEQLKWNKILDEKYKIPKDTGRNHQDLKFTPQHQFQHPIPVKTPSKPAKFVVGSVEDDTESSQSSDENDKQKPSINSDDLNENFPQMEWNSSVDTHSAESIAMMLMSKFKHRRLPNPKNLLFLVNESQAPQQLLPVPDSFTYNVNPDEQIHFNTAIRGSKDWAPPRQQIIFTVHPPPDRKRLMAKQLNRCAGCGMKVQPAHVHRFRYCDYLGKYFCTACHKMQISATPARVLDKWDFALFPVSNFAYKWLDQIWNLPLFHVADLNPTLYQKVKQLAKAREARMQLKYVQEFIAQCRFTDNEQTMLKELPCHWLDDIDIWSMCDFIDVKNSIFTNRIQEIIKLMEDHVTKCEVSYKKCL